MRDAGARTAYIDGIGLLGPGLPNWTAGEAVLLGQSPTSNDAYKLPAARTCRPPSAGASAAW